MIHNKFLRASSFKKVPALLLGIVIILAVSRYLVMGKSIQAYSHDSKDTGGNQNIYQLIIDMAVPMVDVGIDGSSSLRSQASSAFSFLRSLIKFDAKNPISYLSSEIPLLSLVDNNRLNASVSSASGSSINNKPTDTPQVESRGANFANDKPITDPKIDPDKPGVIIYHTHTTESYIATPAFNYQMTGDYRTTDRNYNVCRVGDEVKSYLETYYGIGVVHDITIHDNPSYNGSYQRSKPTVEKLVKKYPDAKFVLDIHRDAFPDHESGRKAMVTDIRGEQVAKVMIVIGKSNPHWQENYYLALKLNQKMEELFPGLTRKIDVKTATYNQEVSNKSMIIEIGSDCNTIEESFISARMVAKAIGEVMKAN